MSSAAERTRLRLSILEVIAFLDLLGDGAGVVRGAFPVGRIGDTPRAADAADLLLLARIQSAPPAFTTTVETLLSVFASAESSIEMRTLGTAVRTVVYGVGPEWTADVVIGEDGDCTIGLLPTGDVPADLRGRHLVLDSSLDMTLLVRGAAGPVDLVFADGVLANARGELVTLRGSGVPPSEFGDLLEKAIAGYLATGTEA